MDDLYTEIIVDHYRNPRNFGEMSKPDYKKRGANASCGDMVEFFIKGKNRVEDVSFRGIGCALSTASASMLSEKIKGLDFDQVAKIDLNELKDMLGIEISPTRMKCVELPLRVLKDVLEEK